MTFQARYAGFLLFFGISGLVGWQTYTYIFDTEPAFITLTGIDDETWCAGDTACTIMSNKKGDVSIFLDDQPLINEAYIPVPCEEKANEYLFSVDVADNVGNTVRLDNKFQVVAFPFKKHALTVSKEVVDQEHELGTEAQVFESLVAKLTEESP